MVYQPLLDAVVNEAPLEAIRSILAEAPVEEVRRGHALNDVISRAMHTLSRRSATIHSDVFVFLIQQDPSCAFVQRGGHFLLHSACQDIGRHVEVIKLLVELNPRALREVDDQGYYPLHLACIAQAPLATVKMLVNHDAEVLRLTSERHGYLPLHLLPWCGADVARFFIQQYPEGTGIIDRIGLLPIHHACYLGEPLDLIQLFIEIHPACLHVQDSQGRLPLHYACHGSASLSVLQYLLVLYPDGIHVADENGWLPIHFASESDSNLAKLRRLVHADPLTLLRKTQDGRTPLRLAYRRGRATDEIRAFLLEEQELLVRAHRFAVEFVAKVQLGFSDDAVVDKIWQFAQPDVWHPSDDDD